MMISEVRNATQVAEHYIDTHALDADEKKILLDFAKVIDFQFKLRINIDNQVKVKHADGSYEYKWKGEEDASQQ